MNLRASFFMLLICGCSAAPQNTAVTDRMLQPALATFQNASGVLPPPPVATIRILPAGVDVMWDCKDGLTYNLYWGTSSHSYSQRLDAGTNSFAIVNGLEKGRAYYFAVTAVDASGIESDFSTELKAVPPNVLELAFNPPGTALQSSTDLLAWNDRAALAVSNTWHVTMNPKLPQEFFRSVSTN